MWQNSGNQATFAAPPLSGSIDPRKPEEGIQALAWQGVRVPHWKLLAITAPLRRWNDELVVREQYIRGDDLVADYQQVTGPNVAPQIYWRVHRTPVAGLEAIVSLHTSLLASRPETSISSAVMDASQVLFGSGNDGTFETLDAKQMPASQRLKLPGVNIVVARPAGLAFSYAEMIAPGDCANVEFDRLPQLDGWRWEYRLFRGPLEKGVIRRERVQIWFLPRQGDTELAHRLYREFCESSPPITA